MQETKTFSQVFSAFLKTSLNFEHFQKEDDPHTLYTFKITDSKKRREINVKKSRFRGPSDKATL